MRKEEHKNRTDWNANRKHMNAGKGNLNRRGRRRIKKKKMQ